MHQRLYSECPLDIAVPSRAGKDASDRQTWIKKLTLRVQRLEQRSMYAPEFEQYELHLVRWDVSRVEALQDLCAVSPYLASIVDSTVIDDPTCDGGSPIADEAQDGAIVGFPIDNAPVGDLYVLYQAGWSLEEVTRYWPGRAGIARDDHHHRAARVATRADGHVWTYYRTTGTGFIYARKRQWAMKVARHGRKFIHSVS